MTNDERRDVVVLTVSDSVDQGARDDLSGDALTALLEASGWTVTVRRTVPDERDRIGAALRDAADDGIALVVSTGGTGMSPRDVTPEATRAVADRPVPGLAERMRAHGRDITPMADLSRAEVAVVGSTSQRTGRAPVKEMAETVGTAVLAAVTTSRPGPAPRAKRALVSPAQKPMAASGSSPRTFRVRSAWTWHKNDAPHSFSAGLGSRPRLSA